MQTHIHTHKHKTTKPHADALPEAFRNIPGVDTACVQKLNLLTLAPGGHFGRFLIWTEGAFKYLNKMYGTLKSGAPLKRGYTLPRAQMENADVARIINSTEVQSVLRRWASPRFAPPHPTSPHHTPPHLTSPRLTSPPPSSTSSPPHIGSRLSSSYLAPRHFISLRLALPPFTWCRLGSPRSATPRPATPRHPPPPPAMHPTLLRSYLSSLQLAFPRFAPIAPPRLTSPYLVTPRACRAPSLRLASPHLQTPPC